MAHDTEPTPEAVARKKKAEVTQDLEWVARADRAYWTKAREMAENHGDAESAKELIAVALWSLESDQRMDPDVHAFLVRALREILDDVPPRDALMLTKPEGRQAGRTLARDMSLAAAVELRMHAGDVAKSKAIGDVASELGPRWGLNEDSEKTVARAYRQIGPALGAGQCSLALLHELAVQAPKPRRSR